ncbi:NAD-dependent epimerase/dehydratase family protein [bacterium]|nr:NAD-dependent epimerase/dehydratase family protein [bacterium]
MNILITGIHGFLGSHTAKAALERGHTVRGSLRSLEREPLIRTALNLSEADNDRLELVRADLLDPLAWNDACRGMDGVIHTASPFPERNPPSELELIRTARQGSLNVLQAAHQSGVAKVVLTSSTGAVAYGRLGKGRSGVFGPDDWTDPEVKADTNAYYRSKTLAERAAWEWAEDSGLELTTICPGALLGPPLLPSLSASLNLVLKLMKNAGPALPNIGYDAVDVRSVAELHVVALERQEAAGRRWLATSDYVRFEDLAQILRLHFPNRRFPKSVLPDWGVRLFSHFEPTLKPILIELGAERRMDCAQTRTELGWAPRPLNKAITDCANALVVMGLAG